MPAQRPKASLPHLPHLSLSSYLSLTTGNFASMPGKAFSNPLRSRDILPLPKNLGLTEPPPPSLPLLESPAGALLALSYPEGGAAGAEREAMHANKQEGSRQVRHRRRRHLLE